ncbi:MAG: hypothetical protein ABW217_17270, partial [Polyangiaceae bacterium]
VEQSSTLWNGSWVEEEPMSPFRLENVPVHCLLLLGATCACASAELPAPPDPDPERGALGVAAQALGCSEGERLFTRETFGGNGRTCATCHSAETGTVSPEDARRRSRMDEHDPLFLHDGSDDGAGHGVERMLADATVLVEIALPPNVSLAGDPSARSVTVRRGIPSTLDTPALDPVLMLDGRQPSLEAQAAGAAHDHAQSATPPTPEQLRAIAAFEQSDAFFSSRALRQFARGGPPPDLPRGRTRAEQRGRRFFEDVAPGASGKLGLCAGCHSGPMLNESNEFLPFPLPVGSRFQTVGVSELNRAQNPVYDFVFTAPDGSTKIISSPDPGRALITGLADESLGEHVNAFKTSSLWGVARTAPYFHDNSAKTLEDVAAHYADFFAVVTDPDGPGPAGPAVVLTPRDQADIVAYLELL